MLIHEYVIVFINTILGNMIHAGSSTFSFLSHAGGLF